MTKSTITRERMEEIRDCCWMNDLGLSMDELSELARMALAAMDSEPVAWTWHHPKQWHVTNDEERVRDLVWDGVKVEPLYRHAQPAPVVPEEFQPVGVVSGWEKITGEPMRYKFESSKSKEELMGSAIYLAPPALTIPQGMTRDNVPFRYSAPSRWDSYMDGWNACRAAMLNHPSSIQPNTGAAPGAEIKHPSTNSPAIPDGYVMVPKEPTAEMLAAAKEWTGLTSTAEVVYIKMLAAAPQEVR